MCLQHIPMEMRAVLQTDPHLPQIELTTLPTPSFDLGAGEHLIQVQATSPCRGELEWWNMVEAMGMTLNLSKRFVPCFDLAGIVVKRPPDSPFQAGDAVFTRTSEWRPGNAAEYTVALTSELAPKPTSLS